MSKEDLILQKLEALEGLLFQQKPVLNLDECALLTGLSRSYIYKLTASKRIPHYTAPGGKLLSFKRDEILNWMTAHRVNTIDAIEAAAISYINKTKSPTKR